jgi:hypothetical protein
MSVGPLSLEQPLEIDEARRAARVLAQQRRDAEQLLEQQVEKAAEAERSYRKSLALAFLDPENPGTTAASKEAWAKDRAAEAGRDRDIQQGLVRAFTERLRGLEGERAMLRVLIDWSQRMSADEHEHRARRAA